MELLKRHKYTIIIAVVSLLVIILVGLRIISQKDQHGGPGDFKKLFSSSETQPQAPKITASSAVTKTLDKSSPGAVPPAKVIDLNQASVSQDLKDATKTPPAGETGGASQLPPELGERKKQLGLDKSVTAVVKSGEAVKVGGTTISMSQIREDVKQQKHILDNRTVRGEDLPSDIKTSMVQKKVDTSKVAPYGQISDTARTAMAIESQKKAARAAYGLYLVRPNDNLWDIHFRFLREYLGHRGIILQPRDDQPMPNGRSSGVGKILKFAEVVAYVYNAKERKLVREINLIHPNEKIVVFNMELLSDILDKVDRTSIQKVTFDGVSLRFEAS
ncbi:MAG: hypothetical protein HQK57_09540 [Deltaproteobacteria bacterium]|nr:hypothetical protein [Deltaproteobacteria bacterium]